MLTDAGYLLLPNFYGIRDYDNYVLVDGQGIIRYTSAKETRTGVGRFSNVRLRAAIDENLRIVPVTPTTWSAVKSLYSGRPSRPNP